MAASYVSLFDLGESRDDVEVDYNSLHHYRVTLKILEYTNKLADIRIAPVSENNFTGHCFKNIATPPPFPKMIIPPCTPMHVHYATMKALIHEGPEMQAYLYFLLQNDSGSSTPDTVKPREVNKYVQCVAFT